MSNDRPPAGMLSKEIDGKQVFTLQCSIIKIKVHADCSDCKVYLNYHFNNQLYSL